MTVRITRVLSFTEFVQMGDDAVSQGWYRNDKRMFVPGSAWYQPFYYDPLGEFAAYNAAHPDRKNWRAEPMFTAPPADPNARGFLSPHYWRDWAAKRAPIAVVCPNGEEWEIDRWSSNGDGWTVTGEPPNITCSPSIVAGNYHGWLRNGEFSDA